MERRKEAPGDTIVLYTRKRCSENPIDRPRSRVSSVTGECVGCFKLFGVGASTVLRMYLSVSVFLGNGGMICSR